MELCLDCRQDVQDANGEGLCNACFLMRQHNFLCHSDNSECEDGCDVSADPERLFELRKACEE